MQQNQPPQFFGPMQPQFPFPPPYGFPPGQPWGYAGPFPPFPPPQFSPQMNQWVGNEQEDPPQGQHNSQNQQPPGRQQDQDQQRNRSNPPKQSQKKKIVTYKEAGSTSSGGIAAQMSYCDTICMGCGEPGHFKQSCDKKQMCFICKSTAHSVEDCPVKKRPRQMAKYIGSAAPGLGFYHIECPETVVNPVVSNKNCGMVVIEEGEITKEELAKEFSDIYKTNWPWQIRDLGQWCFLVQFPPHLPVEQVIGYPRFGLGKSDVWVRVEKWDCQAVEPVEIIKEAWMKVTGLDSQWCEWGAIEQAVSVCGILLDVDWMSVCKDCSEVVRVKIRVRDPTKVPQHRLFHYHGGLYQLQFEMELDTVVDARRKPTDFKETKESDKNEDDSNNGPRDNMEADGRKSESGKSANTSQNSSKSGGGGTSGKQHVGHAEIPDDAVLDGSAIYKLLLERGAVYNDRFVWDNSDRRDSETGKEVRAFWLENQGMSLTQKLELVEESRVQEVQLPDDIMPSFEEMSVRGNAGQEESRANKKSKWGPVQPIRKSARIDSSKNVIEKAKESKMRRNLEIPNKRMAGVAFDTELPKTLDATTQRSSRRKSRAVRKPAAGKAQGAAGDRTRLSCLGFDWFHSWASTVASPYGGRASLAYLQQHPQEASSIHVVM